MTMLKGYAIPSPGAGDGEYGGFGGVQFAAYAQSPANHPYWEGQGIAKTIPALNGFGAYGARSRAARQAALNRQPGWSTDSTGRAPAGGRHGNTDSVHGYGDEPQVQSLLGSLTPNTAALVGGVAGYLHSGVKGGLIAGALAYFAVEKLKGSGALGAYGEEMTPHGEATNPAAPMTTEAIRSTGADGLSTSAANLGDAAPSGGLVKLAVVAFLAWKFIL